MHQLLRRKLLLASVIFVAVLPILASALFITFRSFQQAKLDAVDRAKSLLSHISEKQDELIVQTMQSLRVLALLPEVRGGGKRCDTFMIKFMNNNPVYDNAALIDAKGNLTCSGLEARERVHVRDRDWFRLAVQTGSAQISTLQFGKVTGRPGIVAALPLKSVSGDVESVLTLTISVAWLEDVFAEYSLPEKSQITALDTQGIVLFQHPMKVEGEASLMGKPYPNEKIWKHIKGSGEAIQPARVIEDGGKKHVYTFERIEAEDRVAMVVALRFLESGIYRDATRNVTTLILGLLLSLVATFLIAYVAGNYLFLKPVEQEIDRLQDVAETDPLTQVLNRRGFTRLAHERLVESPLNEHHSVLVMDIDYFKKINDEHGHATGDEVLKETANRIRGVLRESEIFARIGGEEFAIFIPSVTRDNAILLAERIRIVIDSLPYETGTGTLKVAASLGVCHATNKITLDKFLERADKALYKSKRSGRNRVSI